MPRRVMPPVYLLLAVVSMTLLHLAAPGARLVHDPYRSAGIPIIAIGLVLVLWVAGMFRRAGTTIRPFQESTALVVDGPFRWSRNPIYLGMVIALFGIAIVLGSITPLAVIPAFAILIDRKFVRAEERILEARFGEAYRAYVARVRRWI